MGCGIPYSEHYVSSDTLGSIQMAIRTRSLIILFLLVAAILCYVTGYMAGLFFLVALGAVFELFLWAKLLRKRR